MNVSTTALEGLSRAADGRYILTCPPTLLLNRRCKTFIDAAEAHKLAKATALLNKIVALKLAKIAAASQLKTVEPKNNGCMSMPCKGHVALNNINSVSFTPLPALPNAVTQ